jgi:hypothetical protein
MNKSWDLTLQFLFILGLIVLTGLFYVTRLAPSRAGSEQVITDPYLEYTSVYQFEQEENRLLTRIKVLKADYASDLSVYLSEKADLERNAGLSELEKREKQAILDELYSNHYFQRKLESIDQENGQLEHLLEVKCSKYCVYGDLPSDL